MSVAAMQQILPVIAGTRQPARRNACTCKNALADVPHSPLIHSTFESTCAEPSGSPSAVSVSGSFAQSDAHPLLSNARGDPAAYAHDHAGNLDLDRTAYHGAARCRRRCAIGYHRNKCRRASAVDRQASVPDLMAPAKQLLGSKPVSARHLRHRCFARKRFRDDLRLGLGRPASPPARRCNHLDAADVPSISVKRMVIHMVKPIPMKESGPSRITIAHAMWGRNYAYEYPTISHDNGTADGGSWTDGVVIPT